MNRISPLAAPLVALHDRDQRGFASDNYAGVHPQVLEAIAVANGGHQTAYGDDVYSARLTSVLSERFGKPVEAYPVFNGTGANVVALRAACERWEAVVCTDSAHIHVDECGAPEAMGGVKLLVVPGVDGKLVPASLDTLGTRRGDEHTVQPRVVSITQATELGTVYTTEEIAAVVDAAHERNLLVHVDGSRLANAAAHLGVDIGAIVGATGVDLVSLGGTKNGMLMGEAVVALNPDAARGWKFVRKQSMQLASKMRFVSAQLLALYEGDLHLQTAGHANAMAARLADAVAGLPGLTLRPVQANAVFATLPIEVSLRLQERFHFYFWNETTGEVRWMCSWDTTPADVDAFAAAIRAELT
ncbi:low specificity L-threonine aldolase [Nocardioides sp. R-C-SC26]|uniref:threonine aldolase family protein n=1 Tax=Nocardioides sp. R-C-SC26 TaxID=2870414 RepID=UPI001E3D5B69|nr:low specificity L-threonine aldolase [Nocardioides sp. R-C-SC26]